MIRESVSALLTVAVSACVLVVAPAAAGAFEVRAGVRIRWRFEMNKAFAVLFLCLAGCNYDTGECWVRGEGEEGFGGGVIIPTGVGGYGDAPPGFGGVGQVPLQPQRVGGAPAPCEHQLVDCTVTWKAGSEVCKGQKDAGTCTTLYQNGHASLEEAKQRCEYAHGVGAASEALSCGPCKWTTGSANNSCRKDCEEKANACEAECRKLPEDDKPGRAKCWAACNNAYAQCIKKCKD